MHIEHEFGDADLQKRHVRCRIDETKLHAELCFYLGAIWNLVFFRSMFVEVICPWVLAVFLKCLFNIWFCLALIGFLADARSRNEDRFRSHLSKGCPMTQGVPVSRWDGLDPWNLTSVMCWFTLRCAQTWQLEIHCKWSFIAGKFHYKLVISHCHVWLPESMLISNAGWWFGSFFIFP